MTQWILRAPRTFLAVLAILVFALVTRGGFSDVDTHRRAQVTHWLWSSAPQVAADERDSISRRPTPIEIAMEPHFCDLKGANGEIYAQFAIGQSLIMLPGDLLAGVLSNELFEPRGTFVLHDIVVNLVTFAPIAAIAVVLSFELLLLLGFATPAALGASTLLLVGTTFVLYVQDSAENSQLYALYVGALVALLAARKARLRRNLALAGACLGLAVLIKLPSLAYVVPLLVMAKAASDDARGGKGAVRLRLTRAGAGDLARFVGPIAIALLTDRAYQFYRFREVFSTYMKQCAEAFAATGAYPPGYPFGYPLLEGALGPILDPTRSIFLFDPLLVVALVVIAARWRGLCASRKAVLASTLASFVLLALAFGSSWYWNGGIGSWGARHHLVPVEVAMLVGFALVIERFAQMSLARRIAIVAGGPVACVVQTSALAYPPILENLQAATGDPLRLVQLLRLRNLHIIAMQGPLALPQTAPGEQIARIAKTLADPTSSQWPALWRLSAAFAPDLRPMFLGLWLVLAALVVGAVALALSLPIFVRPLGEADDQTRRGKASSQTIS